MKFGRNFIPAYNAQAAVTGEQIIVGAEITTEGGDFEQLWGVIPIVAPDTTRNRRRKTRLGGPYDVMRRVLATERGDELYSRRPGMVEPVFGQIKANRRMGRFKRRGRAPPARNGA
jgi:hypothetical protein